MKNLLPDTSDALGCLSFPLILACGGSLLFIIWGGGILLLGQILGSLLGEDNPVEGSIPDNLPIAIIVFLGSVIAMYLIGNYTSDKDEEADRTRYFDETAEELVKIISHLYYYLNDDEIESLTSLADIRARLEQGDSPAEIVEGTQSGAMDMGLDSGAVFIGCAHPPRDRLLEISRAQLPLMKEHLWELEDAKRHEDSIPKKFPELDKLNRLEEINKEVGEKIFAVPLFPEVRKRHVYIIGKSGTGKTTLMQQMIISDMKAGRGIGVIAPEAEFFEEQILPFVPEYRTDDVVYFNPADPQCRVPLNPLHLEEGEDIDLKADEVFTTLSRVIGSAGTPRINELLRQSVYTLLEIPNTTILDISKLLDRDNSHYRNHVISILKDQYSADFWRNQYPTFPKDALVPILYRLGQFTRSKKIRNSLCNPDGNIDFREIMDSGKIALFNLSDGLLGEQNSRLLGQLVMSGFQMATIGRANVSAKSRRQFYLYVDEFQTFTSTANASYDKILERSRKYNLSLILAHQQTGQIPDNLIRQIFGNVNTMISFGVGAKDARLLSAEFRADPDIFRELRVGMAVAKIGGRILNPVFTFPPPSEPDTLLADDTARHSPSSDTDSSIPSPTVAEELEADTSGAFGGADPDKVF